MKKILHLSLLFWSFTFHIMAQNKEKAEGVLYEIFVQSFADSNGDGIGDLNGIRSKIPYLVELGVTSVWLMPIHPSPSYHKYDITDYYGIHPDYGTADDFKMLVDELHQAGITLIIDFVANHCSKDHPMFVAAAQDPKSIYRPFFLWSKPEQIDSLTKEKTGDSDNLYQWHDAHDSEEKYYGFFSSHMPDFNFDHAPARNYIFDVAQYWIKEYNIDGYRLDAARHIYDEAEAEKSHAFWKEFRKAVELVRKDAVLIGEVWGHAEEVTPYYEGIKGNFNFDLSWKIQDLLTKGVFFSPIDYLNAYRNTLQAVREDFIDPIFLTNHDQNRIMSVLDHDKIKAKMAANLLFTLPGMPVIYYGEELGMMGMKPDEYIREPFMWDKNDANTTRWMKPKYNLTSTVASLTQQKNNSNSIFRHYKQWIAIRKHHPEWENAVLIALPNLPEGMIGYRIGAEYVIHNTTSLQQRISFPETINKIIFASQDQITTTDKEIILSPWSSVVFR